MGLHGLLDVVRRLWETAKANHTFYLCPYANSSIGISWTRSKNEMRMPDMSLRLHDLRYQPLENAYAALLLRLCDAARSLPVSGSRLIATQIPSPPKRTPAKSISW